MTDWGITKKELAATPGAPPVSLASRKIEPDELSGEMEVFQFDGTLYGRPVVGAYVFQKKGLIAVRLRTDDPEAAHAVFQHPSGPPYKIRSSTLM